MLIWVILPMTSMVQTEQLVSGLGVCVCLCVCQTITVQLSDV